MKKLETLKVGDKAVIYDRYSTRIEPREYSVIKIGRKFIHVSNCKYDVFKFSIDKGYGNYGQSLFPGSLDEFNEYISLKDYKRDVINKLNAVIDSLSKEELDNIMSIINH